MIINRSFWPVNAVIGEAMLKLAEEVNKNGYSVFVVFQDKGKIKEELKKAKRGEGISFYPVKALTNSASRLILRIIDNLFFTFLVLINLLRIRPNKIYVSTDPPIFIPFVTMLYCRICGANYVYHLQDIHPEATNVVIKIPKILFNLLKSIDTLTLKHAKSLITITEEMAQEIQIRSNKNFPIHILSNPAISFNNINLNKPKIAGFSFCGNAGRLQRIPLVLNAIESYIKQGGKMRFTFAGGGIYKQKLEEFTKKFKQFKYYGLVNPEKASKITSKYTWSLLPIEDEVTKYAFPSKTSSYVYSKTKILAICSQGTSVANWVKKKKVGLVISPKIDVLVRTFFNIERGIYDIKIDELLYERLNSELGLDIFVSTLYRIILEQT